MGHEGTPNQEPDSHLAFNEEMVEKAFWTPEDADFLGRWWNAIMIPGLLKEIPEHTTSNNMLSILLFMAVTYLQLVRCFILFCSFNGGFKLPRKKTSVKGLTWWDCGFQDEQQSAVQNSKVKMRNSSQIGHAKTYFA